MNDTMRATTAKLIVFLSIFMAAFEGTVSAGAVPDPLETVLPDEEGTVEEGAVETGLLGVVTVATVVDTEVLEEVTVAVSEGLPVISVPEIGIGEVISVVDDGLPVVEEAVLVGAASTVLPAPELVPPTMENFGLAFPESPNKIKM